MADKLVGHLMNDFIDLYSIFYPNKDRTHCINGINNGFCGVAAMCVGNVLVSKYGYDQKTTLWKSHCLHMWLNVNGVDYDTLYPEGYPASPEDHWLLDNIEYNSNVLDGEVTLEGNPGYMQPHLWSCMFLVKAWYRRHGIQHPVFLDDMISHLKAHSSNHRKRKYRLALARDKKAQALPLFDPTEEKPVVTNDVYPMTWYWHGEFEENTTRKLLPYRWKTYRQIYRMRQLASKLHGFEVTRLVL